jgi:hypothetical protein
MAPVKPPTLYIDRKPYFLDPPTIATNLPPLGNCQGGGETRPNQHHLQGRRGPRSRCPPRAAALLGGRRRRPAAAGASPSPSSSSGLHLFINNLRQCFLLDLHHEGWLVHPLDYGFVVVTGPISLCIFIVEVCMMCLAWLWNYLCNFYGCYCVMRWYLLCIYYCVETLRFVILRDCTYDTCNEFIYV